MHSQNCSTSCQPLAHMPYRGLQYFHSFSFGMNAQQGIATVFLSAHLFLCCFFVANNLSSDSGYSDWSSIEKYLAV